jgi:hypothetical protein
MKMAADSMARGGLLERPWVFWTMLVAATVLGAALRFYGLEKPSFWDDEFFTIARAGRDPLHWTSAFGYLPTGATLWLQGAELGRIGLDNIAEWKKLGVTEWGARLGPCWIGVLSIPILGLAARPVVGSGAAMVATLLLALSPWHVYWSQMARYYTAQFLFANLFLLGFAWGATKGSWRALAWAAASAVLAYLAHPTVIVMVGICAGCVALAWAFRFPNVAPPRAAVALAAVIAACVIVYLFREMAAREWGGLSRFSKHRWDPSLTVLVVGTALRINLVVAAVAVLSAVALVRARNPIGVLLGAVAILSPLAFFVLKYAFPIGPRYYLFSLFAWALLAGVWATEVDRRLSGTWGRLAGTSGAVALAASVGFGAYLYAWDGAGERARWREAYGYVLQRGDPSRPVFADAGRLQAKYYLGREVMRLPKTASEVASLAPGTWVVHRTRGAQPPVYGDLLDVKARYEIPSKPWSWVLYVMRVAGP